MMTIEIIFALLLINVLADQILQFPLILRGKDEHVSLMIAHVTTWALWMIPVCSYMVIKVTHDFTPFLWWMVISTIHFIVDYLMGIWVNHLIKKKNFHHAVVVIHINALIMNLIIIKSFFVMVIWS